MTGSTDQPGHGKRGARGGLRVGREETQGGRPPRPRPPQPCLAIVDAGRAGTLAGARWGRVDQNPRAKHGLLPYREKLN